MKAISIQSYRILTNFNYIMNILTLLCFAGLAYILVIPKMPIEKFYIISILIIVICSYIKYRSWKIKYYYINIFNQNMNGDKYEELVNQTKINPKFKIINVPINMDLVATTRDKIYIYQYANKEHTFYKLLTIINRKDPNFDDKLFWRMHTTPYKKYLLGLTDQPY